MQYNYIQEVPMKSISIEIIQLCKPGFDMAKMNELIEALFTNARTRAQELTTDLDKDALQMIADKLVVNQLLNQLYFLDTSEVQIACLHQISQQNANLRDAFEFVQAQNNYIPVDNRSEEDEKIQRFLKAILA
ncbi:hypothetical protein ICN41_03265 [Polynucleobacter sp. 15G-AUS-farblos]|uniref:hypothetical protein n=1 Tax=Polynucleobacter sp. 15G-AUS-farblos TaxID=2689094 RepID=UPI001C0B58F2|nr:hypothetical protein [Polynucleobacter sp. 15G-AUS-farblos]MBU3583005.1 hypothetical protein [Polynucleobacter sp. 15G-AUS-farblos]